MKSAIFLLLALLALFYVSSVSSVNAGPVKNNEFLRFTPSQQDIWYKGAFDVLGHLVYQYDKKGAACIWQWLNENTSARKHFLNEYLENNPGKNPTTTILILLKSDCKLML